jgi:hypothetical protein
MLDNLSTLKNQPLKTVITIIVILDNFPFFIGIEGSPFFSDSVPINASPACRTCHIHPVSEAIPA